MEGKKVVFFEVDSSEQDFFRRRLEGIDATYYPHRFTHNHLAEAEIADYLVSFIYSDWSDAILEQLPKLKGIATMSVGVDHIGMAVVKKREIAVSNVPAYGPNTVAEHALALLLSLSRKIVPSVERTRSGVYEYSGLTGWDLAGKTLAVVGTGKIGSHVARIAHGLDMRLIGYDPHPNTELTEKYGLEYMPLPQALASADVITLHVPLTAENKHMLSEREFALMKNGVVIINSARGALIDANALLAAIESGKVAEAGIDVLEDEGLLKEEKEFFSPYFKLLDYQTALANHALMRHPKVLVTPHNAFNSREALENILGTTVKNLTAMMSGSPINSAVK